MSTIQQMVGMVPGVGSSENGSATTAARQTVVKAMAGGDRTGRASNIGDASSQGGKQEVDRATLEEMAQQLNETMNSSVALRFKVDGESDKLVVRVVDRDTEELIRQIPNEDFLELSRRMRQMRGGLFEAKA